MGELVERLRDVTEETAYAFPWTHRQLLRQAADAIERMSARCERMEEALQDIGLYGCGMLSQPAALNELDEVWLRRRVNRMEQVARTALKETGDGLG